MFLRKATDDDLELIMAWRSNPLVYEGFYSQTAPLTWEEHIIWWYSRNQDWHQFIILADGHDIGVVTIVQCDNWSPEIGFYIGEVSLWGKGYGSRAVGLAEEWLKEKGYVQTHTTVKEDNKRAISLLKHRGWKRAGNARKGELRFEREL
jgi:RimJ/RimL family protein N-acetyltransferase